MSHHAPLGQGSADMEQLSVSERLPRLYRAVLDAVADLEANGRRRDAAAIRADAIAAYSKAWNAVAERRLTSLRARAERIIEMSRPTTLEAVPKLSRPVDLEHTTV